jgi:hypothetical protein
MGSRLIKNGAYQMKLWLIFLLLQFAVVVQVAHATDNCPPAPYNRTQLQEIKQSGFEIEYDGKRNTLAIALLACVSDSDPDIRDGIAYEGIATWLRGKKLNTETNEALYAGLLLLIANENDENGFEQPFAALILSEVARTDRVEDTFSPEKRAELVNVAALYLSNVRDYRGFSESEGWRHGVAHGADLVLQLVLNENINDEQVALLMEAIATQVSPPGEVFYIYGEPGRLARAAFYAHRRAVLTTSFWQTWFEAISNPEPLESWNSSYSTQSGLAKRHNTLAFLSALNLYASASNDEQSNALSMLVIDASKAVF